MINRCFRQILFVFFIVVQVFSAYSQSDNKIDSLQEIIDLHLSNNDTSEIFNTYYQLAKQLRNESRYYESGVYFENALEFANDQQQMKIYNNLGTICWYKGEYDEAMRMYRKILELSELSKNQKYQAIALNNIGFVYAEHNNQQKSLEYYQKALKIRLKIKNKKGIAQSYLNIGSSYFSIDSFSKALHFFDLSLKIFKEIEYSLGESHVLNGIGNVYLENNQLLLAMKYHNEGLVIRKRLNHTYLIAESYKNIAKDYIKLGDYNKANLVIQKGILISKKIDSKKKLKEFYYQLYELKTTTKQYKNALEAYLKYAEVKDSLFSIESENIISELEIKYETEKKEQRILFLNTKNELSKQTIIKQKNNLIYLFSGFAILFISLVIVLYIYFQRNKAYKMLVKQNIEIVNLETEKQNIATKNRKKTKISNEQKIVNDLICLIEENKYFLNQDCSIEKLAKEINTNRQYLSKIINEKFETSFNNFINTYRIKEACKMLLDSEYDKYTIESIGEIAGFNNRATFNTAFKKITGVTPSFFKKEQKFQ